MGKEVVISNEISRNSAIEDIMAVDVSVPHVMTLKPYKRDRGNQLNSLSHV